MKFTIATHSVIDLITNSSTEMFMDFTGSIEPLKELINEILKIGGTEKKCDDIFNLSIRPDWWEEANEHWDGHEEGFNPNNWTDDGESRTILHIETKDPEYDNFGKLVLNFINSVDMNEYMC